MRPEISDLNSLVAALLAHPAPSPERATQLLAEHGGASTFALLLEMLAARRAGARKLAADALAALGSRQAIPDLAILLADPEPAVRSAAQRALDQLDPPAVAQLQAQPKAGVQPASSAGMVTKKLTWPPAETGSPRRRLPWRRALSGAVLLAGLGLGGLFAPSIALPTSVAQLVVAPEQPGIGRPARDASWEVLLERVHHEASLPSMSGSYTPHDEHEFLVVDLKIQSLAAKPASFAPNAVSLALPDNSAVYTPELIGLSSGGDVDYNTPLGLIACMIDGEMVYKDGQFTVPKAGLTVSFAFVMKQKDRARPFELRFASLPAIPFVAGTTLAPSSDAK